MASSTTQTVTPRKQQQQDSSSSSSSSKRHFHWTNKVGTELDDPEQQPPPCLLKSSSSSAARPPPEKKKTTTGEVSERRKKLPQVAVARLRSVVLSALGRTISRDRGSSSLGSRVVGTLFGSRRGHVHFAFQKSPASQPTFLIELATPISGLVKEMASGLVRIALECDKRKKNDTGKKTTTTTSFPLLEENTWRTYCNGKKSGFATRRDCGPHDWKILKAVEPISMGAGVLPPLNDNDDKNDKNSSEDDVMYMRAKFERIVGSRDSEAFYMMNPDSNGAPELSIYLLRL